MLKTSIPFVDLRGKTPIDLLRAWPDKAHALIHAARRVYGPFSYGVSALALPLADRRSHAWLKRSWNPYLYEIETFADILECPGIYALNLSYEWGCTSGAYSTEETVSLLRVLDWPFPELGRHAMVVLQRGKAGEFYNVGWPGLSGVYTGMAAGRFAAAVNMAPMRKHGLGLAGDWIKNQRMLGKQLGFPPSHLLRLAFEQAHSYDDARHMLTHTRVAAPVIYTLAGTQPGQGCIIERLENTAAVIELGAEQSVSAANHFTTALAQSGRGWRPREVDSHGRLRQSRNLQGYDLRNRHFDWLQAPVVNRYTRLCVIADAGSGRLMVQGYEGTLQVTEVLELRAQMDDDYREAV